MNKKGQAAMEYLITYGWAILVIFVIIAVLYSSIFKPEFYAQERCEMAPGIECSPMKMALKPINDEIQLRMILTNSMGYDIEVLEVNYTVDSTTFAWKAGYPGGSIDEVNWKDGEDNELIYNFDKDVFKKTNPGSMQRIKFAILYNITSPVVSGPYRTAGIINIRMSK